MEHFTVGGCVTFLDTQRTAVYQDSLAVLVLGSEAECVFARDNSVVILERSLFAFLDEQVELELIGVLSCTGINDLAALLLGGRFLSRCRSEFGGVLFRGRDFVPLSGCARLDRKSVV